jgi:hypothetical protein
MAMKKRVILAVLAALAMGLVGMGVALAQGTHLVDRWIIAAAGTRSTGGDVTLDDTFGEPIVGPSSGGDVSLQAGYWGQPLPPRPVGGRTLPGDRVRLMAPWVGLAVLVALASAGLVGFRRRRA